MVAPYNPFVEQRRQHILKLISMLEKVEFKDKDRVIAAFCIATGLRRATVLKMLEEIEEADIVEYGRGCDSKGNSKGASKKT